MMAVHLACLVDVVLVKRLSYVKCLCNFNLGDNWIAKLGLLFGNESLSYLKLFIG